jgi:hypothetical protein
MHPFLVYAQDLMREPQTCAFILRHHLSATLAWMAWVNVRINDDAANVDKYVFQV